MLSKLNRNLFFTTIVIATLALISCKKKTERIESKVATFETPDFQEFYKKFGNDSIYQMEHIVFPLEGMKSMKDSLDIPDPDFKWQREGWILHHPFDESNNTFTREWIDLSGIVVERIEDTSGQFSMERRFGQLSSGWHLIYYREMGRY